TVRYVWRLFRAESWIMLSQACRMHVEMRSSGPEVRAVLRSQAVLFMAEYVLHVGCCSAQGLRPNNEDRYVADQAHRLFLVADGMGGQDRGEQASSLAAEIIPRVVQDRLAANDDAPRAVQQALTEANQAIVDAGRNQPVGRRMGTTAVLAVHQADQVYV